MKNKYSSNAQPPIGVLFLNFLYIKCCKLSSDSLLSYSISYNKIVLFISMCIKSNQDCLVIVCSQTNLVYLSMMLITEIRYGSTTLAFPVLK